MLGRFRPVAVAAAFLAKFVEVAVMAPLHFLQEHDVGVELGDGLFEGDHARSAPDRGDAFVDVVGGDANLHGNILTPSMPFLRTRLRQSENVAPLR
ncbi:hypothetical protein LP419_15735 [Massilia sp. H-1]|nr:hypothetical protein LP419_15735 [Massilia sp. H-1]